MFLNIWFNCFRNKWLLYDLESVDFDYDDLFLFDYRVSQKVLQFDKQSNNKLLFYCFKIFYSEYLFIDIDFETLTTDVPRQISFEVIIL